MRYFLTTLLLTLPFFLSAQSADSTSQENVSVTSSDNLTKVQVYLPMDRSDSCGNEPLLRREKVDSLMAQNGFVYVRQDALASLAVHITYESPSAFDIVLIEGKLREICSEITIYRF